MNKLNNVVEYIERTILVLLFGSLVALTGTQIVMRNVLDSGIVWADDAIKVLVLWIAMMGALYATRGARHISIDVASRFLPMSVAAIAKRFLFAVSATVCGSAAWASYQFVLLEYEDPSIAFLSVPTWVTEAIIPVGLLLMALRFLAMVIWLPAEALPHCDQESVS